MIHPWHTVRYAGFIAYEVVTGALRIGADTLTPGLKVSPAILELPLQCQTDLEISVMASSITITPGTLTVGIAPAVGAAPATLYIQAMYAADPASVRADLHEMERLLLRATRGSTGQVAS